MDRKRTTYLLLGAAAALLAFAVLATPQKPLTPPPLVTQEPKPEPRPLPPAAQRPRVEVVFALDTTGSMTGLIDGAKKKIWEIARFIAQGQPTPDLRVGLVAYRDIGDDYVTKTYDLSDDLDAVYQNLSSFTAAGGGDTPEHVAKALHDAVYGMSWSPSNNTLRIIYLVGDAPPHTDYQDGFDFHAIAQTAGERGIRINTVRCGGDPATQVAWLEIAQRAHGEFTTIEQSGGMAEIATPFDGELSALNRKLVGTAVSYGSAERQRATHDKAEAAMNAPAAVQAERAGIFGFLRKKGKAAALASDDLVDDAASHKADLKNLPAGALPAPMQAMKPEERQSYLDQKSTERKQILDQINGVSARRDAFLKAARPSASASAGFDGKVRESLKKQADAIGVRF